MASKPHCHQKNDVLQILVETIWWAAKLYVRWQNIHKHIFDGHKAFLSKKSLFKTKKWKHKTQTKPEIVFLMVFLWLMLWAVCIEARNSEAGHSFFYVCYAAWPAVYLRVWQMELCSTLNWAGKKKGKVCQCICIWYKNRGIIEKNYLRPISKIFKNGPLELGLLFCFVCTAGALEVITVLGVSSSKVH